VFTDLEQGNGHTDGCKKHTVAKTSELEARSTIVEIPDQTHRL